MSRNSRGGQKPPYRQSQQHDFTNEPPYHQPQRREYGYPPHHPDKPLQATSPGDRSRGMCLAFGMFQGRFVRDVPTVYLNWVLKQRDILSFTLRSHIVQVLAERGDTVEGVFSFGKYYGYRFDEVPLGYLEWLVDETTGGQLTAEDREKIRVILAMAKSNRPPDAETAIAGSPPPPDAPPDDEENGDIPF